MELLEHVDNFKVFAFSVAFATVRGNSKQPGIHPQRYALSVLSQESIFSHMIRREGTSRVIVYAPVLVEAPSWAGHRCTVGNLKVCFFSGVHGWISVLSYWVCITF